MRYRKLGSTSVSISEVTFGAASLSGEGGGYGFGAIDQQEAAELVHAALDRGINAFDTAPIYGHGQSEIRLGNTLGTHRNDVLLISKGGIDWHPNRRVNLDNRPETLERMLYESLKRLQTDWIDLYFLHHPDPQVDIRRSMDYLVRAKEQGLIRMIGLSNMSLDDIRAANTIGPIDVLQHEYSWLERSAETNIFPLIREKRWGFMSWGTLAKGILSGHVRPGRRYDPLDIRSWAPWWKASMKTLDWPLVDSFIEEAATAQRTPAQHALRFNLSHDELSSAIVGFRTLEQLDGLCRE